MSGKAKGKKQGTLIDDIALGFTTVLGITGAAAGVFIPGAAIPVAAIQAGAYCPAVVAAIVKRSAHDRRSSEQINEQINSCAELTAKEYLEELKTDRPVMYSLFRDVWEKEDIYDQSPTLGSIEENMKEFLVTETRWEGYGITPKDINDVVDTYVQLFFINAKDYPELNQSILFGVSQKTGELEARQDVLEDKMDGLSNSEKKEIRAFYEYIYGEFTKTPKSDLYGKISLRDGYIEPMIDADGRTQSVREYLESWVESDSTITVIGGEPGHGKTSLCWKAMYDFYKNDWLKDKVDNVFCFSLNPAKTDALNNDSFNLYKLLSWGNNRTNKEHLLDESDCKNALIFFDGFDELKEWYSGLSLKQFMEEEIQPFQEETDSHIVITSRNMAIESGVDHHIILDGKQVMVKKMQFITKSQQISWIESYIEKYREASPVRVIDLEEYLEEFKAIPEDRNQEEIFGIPIIFRILVEARYLPHDEQSIPRIYDKLFHITWIRHKKRIGAENELSAKRRLQKLALKIFIDNNDTAKMEFGSNSPWIFSFYTTHEDKKRVGFLHRTFYQFFLAHEILSWYNDYTEDKNDDRFREHLKYLARRKLDDTTLEFIEEIFDFIDVKDDIEEAFKNAYTILKETDGILALPSDENDKNMLRSAKPIDRANNVFWNIVSLGSVCGQVVTSDNIDTEALRIYGLSGGKLSNAVLTGTHLSNNILKHDDEAWLIDRFMLDMREQIPVLYALEGMDSSETAAIKDTIDVTEFTNRVARRQNRTPFKGVDLRGADFRGTDLRKVYLVSADLGRADLREADLQEADFRCAYLSGACLSEAKLSEADFKIACLIGADLSEADLQKADFRCAYLNGACLSEADLSEADLSGADFSGANLSGANLSKANLVGAFLNRTKLIGADLSEADFSKADLSEADLSGADFSGANLSGATLVGADLSGANFYEANLIGADLNRAHLSMANSIMAVFSELSFSRERLSEADLSDADLTSMNLQEVNPESVSITKLRLYHTRMEKHTADYLEKLGCDISDVIITD